MARPRRTFRPVCLLSANLLKQLLGTFSGSDELLSPRDIEKKGVVFQSFVGNGEVKTPAT